jgi:hypothetical protein
MLRVDYRKPLGLMIRPAVRIAGGSCPVGYRLDDGGGDRTHCLLALIGNLTLTFATIIKPTVTYRITLCFRAVRLNACYRAEYERVVKVQTKKNR